MMLHFHRCELTKNIKKNHNDHKEFAQSSQLTEFIGLTL